MVLQSDKKRNILTGLCLFFVGSHVLACGGNEAKNQDSAKTETAAPPDTGVPIAEPSPTTENVPPPAPAPEATPVDAKAAAEQNVTDECAVAAETFRQSMKKPMDACYQTAKKENPYLSGVAKFVLSFNNKAVMTSVRPDPSTLTKKSIECMTAAIKASKWSDPSCKGKSMTLTRPYERAGE